MTARHLPPVRRPRPTGMRGVLDLMARDLNAGLIPLEDRRRHRDAMRELRGLLELVGDD